MDPLLHIALRGFLAVLIAAALAHKAHDFRRFLTSMRGYGLLPAEAVKPAAVAVISMELVAVLALLLGPASLAATMSAGLFTAYAAVIAVNIRRGRTEIDCGCSWVKAARLSPQYCYRNLTLVCLCLLIAAPTGDRPLIWIDFVNAGFFSVMAAGVYFLVDALLHARHLERVR